jgi:Flp pilus assembly protein TadG
VEFALVAALLFLLLLIAIEGGLALAMTETFAEAAREASRHVTSIHTPAGDRTEATAQAIARTVIQQRFGTGSEVAQQATITVSPSPSGASAGTRITVTVSYDLPSSWLINRGHNITIHGNGVFEMQ